MRAEDSLKSYINFFQSQLIKVSNCGKEVAVLAFINRLQVTHPLYKHLLKHNIAKMSEDPSRAQPYIKVEEAMKVSSNLSTKPSNDKTKSKFSHEALEHAPDCHLGQPPFKKQVLSNLPSV